MPVGGVLRNIFAYLYPLHLYLPKPNIASLPSRTKHEIKDWTVHTPKSIQSCVRVLKSKGWSNKCYININDWQIVFTLSSTMMTNILANSPANKTSNGLNNFVTLTGFKRLVNMLARQLYVVSTWTGLSIAILKGHKDKSGLEGPLRGKQLQMCKERNILWGWHCTKNAHSSHRPLEMESYQTGDYIPPPPPPLIATQTVTEEEKKQQRDRQRWTAQRCNKIHSDFR